MAYLFQRKLKIGYDQMKALPWWQYELYLEGMAWEADPEGFVPRGEAKLDDLGEFGFSIHREEG